MHGFGPRHFPPRRALKAIMDKARHWEEAVFETISRA
jgi:hypothetical protein